MDIPSRGVRLEGFLDWPCLHGYLQDCCKATSEEEAGMLCLLRAYFRVLRRMTWVLLPQSHTSGTEDLSGST